MHQKFNQSLIKLVLWFHLRIIIKWLILGNILHSGLKVPRAPSTTMMSRFQIFNWNHEQMALFLMPKLSLKSLPADLLKWSKKMRRFFSIMLVWYPKNPDFDVNPQAHGSRDLNETYCKLHHFWSQNFLPLVYLRISSKWEVREPWKKFAPRWHYCHIWVKNFIDRHSNPRSINDMYALFTVSFINKISAISLYCTWIPISIFL